ncbi:MAG: dTDP-4-dehydrorhamnose reductase [Deltaproteobacteria bacterium]|jgi:dTDP-4-dehydrorhamnose reductase|nr:dTDP-4-dehydrorhamnose reductase [Deltaproteobacteria bacterium]
MTDLPEEPQGLERKLRGFDPVKIARPSVLLLGGGGQLGRVLAAPLSALGELTVTTRDDLDLAADDFEERLRSLAPKKLKLIVNAAAYTKVDQAESDREKAFRVNARAPALLAKLARERDAALVHYSTDYVYSGDKDSPYQEDDPTGPLNHYGKTKLEGDLQVMDSGARFVILRTSWVYGLIGNNFPHTVLRLAREKETLEMDASQRGAPTSVELLNDFTAFISAGILHHGKDYRGLFHLSSSGECTWLEFARFLVQKAADEGIELKLKPEKILPRKGPEPFRAAKRPINSRLSLRKFSSHFKLYPPHWIHYASRFIRGYKAFADVLKKS